MNIDRTKTAILLATIVAVAVVSGFAISTYAAENNEERSYNPSERFRGRMMMQNTHRGLNGKLPGQGCNRFLEVSEEFKENVINIAESDEDVQNLLNDGYNITRVRPIVKSLVEADGNVNTKATNAILMLENDEAGHAIVKVDLEETKVTEIVIFTKTTIEKP